MDCFLNRLLGAKSIPQALKRRHIFGLSGAAEATPLQNYQR
jgi:hypothetical protein